MSSERIHHEERQYLHQIIEEIDQQLAQIGPRYYGDDYTEQVLDAQNQLKRERLEVLAREPYFGRLDFQEEKEGSVKHYYIGKRGLEKKDSNDLAIIDWRAPVASLFYAFTGGEEKAEYQVPEGRIEGIVHLKRNLVIRERELQRVVDSYVHGEENTGISDEFLLYKLSDNKDNRLRDIVSTIQAEQDRIIRSSRDKILIIQGAAGSGKTTVALHRLAYLLYQYREQLDPRKMMIIAPNAMFIDYISDVLPELGVGNISQTTFADWALQKLDRGIQLEEAGTEGARRFALKPNKQWREDEEASRYKGSVQFMHWLEHAMEVYEKAMLPQLDFAAWEGAVLSADQVKDWFEREYKHYALAPRRERLVGRIQRWLEMELSALPAWVRKEKSRSARGRLRTYLKKIPKPETYAIYRTLFGVPKTAAWMEGCEPLPETVVRSTKRTLKQSFVRQEDLAPLVWIQNYLSGKKENYQHLVIDEAQDLAPFQMALLNQQMREPSMTILGDLAQGIYESRGVARWEQLGELLDRGRISYHVLQQSYRSTMEIIAFANLILAQANLGLQPAQPVFRSGEPVVIERVDKEHQGEKIGDFVHEAEEKGMKTIALIGRTREDCQQLAEQLIEIGLQPQLLIGDETRYQGGLSIVPVDLAKGLEFDAVLLFDVDEVRYERTSLSAKLLYVGCTRALHRLKLLYTDNLTPLLAATEETPQEGVVMVY